MQKRQIIKEFSSFLKEEGCLKEYRANMKKEGMISPYRFWEKSDPEDYIIDAFVWVKKGDEYSNIWSDLNVKWLDKLETLRN